MDKRAETLRHLREFRDVIENQINIEVKYREHLSKKRLDNLDELLSQSVSYQRFLEHMITDVITEVIDDITL